MINETANRLKSITDNSYNEAVELVALVLNVNRASIRGTTPLLNQKQIANLELLVNKRLSGYPLQYILGEWELYGTTFKVGEGVLIPRSDTECLIETCISTIDKRTGLRIADLCSGSGCIAINIAKYCHSNTIFAIEKSPIAFEYLTKNIKLNNSTVIPIIDDVFTTEITNLDIIVCNPPYLTADELNHLQSEVEFEPKMALYGDTDGLSFYRQISSIYKAKMNAKAQILFEIGMGQDTSVAIILENLGYKNICRILDAYGVIRVISACI